MPRLDFWFRLFHHAALALASICLLYSEAFFLPEPLLLGLYVLAGLQVLAFGADGRRWLLPSWVANLLAGAVAGGGAAWIGMELNAARLRAIQPAAAGRAAALHRPAPHRPARPQAVPAAPRRDFWLLQGVGALQAALACVLATTPQSGLLFGVLLVAYVAFTLGCLALHHFREEQSAGMGRAAERLPFAGRMAPFCLRWTLATAALAAPLYLLTPRIRGAELGLLRAGRPGAARRGRRPRRLLPDDRPEPRRPRESRRRGGVPRRGRRRAERIRSRPPPRPAWRGDVLDSYADGRWANEEIKREVDLGHGRTPPPLAPPLGPGRYRLDFTVGPHAGGFFLAEPVYRSRAPASDHPTRVDQVEGADWLRPLVVSPRGPVLPLLNHGLHESRYRQTVYSGDDPNRSVAEDYDLLYDETLKTETVPGLADWTDALLRRLVADPANGLSSADVARIAPEAFPRAVQPLPSEMQPHSFPPPGGSGFPPPAGSHMPLPGPSPPPALPTASWERVGRALTVYLARSGEYTYTLDLRRQDANIDPVMDFLVNVKAGHCRALRLGPGADAALSRRPVACGGGVPGCAGRSDDGAYVIRQNQAHAWVEILVPVRARRPARPGMRPVRSGGSG